MDRIEKVEKVLQPQASLSIVQVAENKRRRGICFPGDRGSTCKALNQPFLVEQIEDNDQKNTPEAVIGHESPGECHSAQGNDQAEHPAEAELVHRPDGPKSDQKCEIDILFKRVEPAGLESQIERNLGDQCENKESPHVFADVVCVIVALDDEKAEDGKRKPPDLTHDSIDGQNLIVTGSICPDGWLIQKLQDNRGAGMVNQHRDAGKQLQRAGRQAIPGAGQAVHQPAV